MGYFLSAKQVVVPEVTNRGCKCILKKYVNEDDYRRIDYSVYSLFDLIINLVSKTSNCLNVTFVLSAIYF